ncbi:hypothetical protein NE865_06419 [Phthorimaea operculella]|nr:hypothetical protein NE865_06419 [Phthorimaea operculella]
MGCMLRSDKLSYCEIFLQPEHAFRCLSRLGEIGCVQFQDMTPHISNVFRRFTPDLCRCAELERILHFIKGEILKDKMHIFPEHGNPPPLKPEELNSLEIIVEKWNENIKETSKYLQKLLKDKDELEEMLYVMKNIDPIIGKGEIQRGEAQMKRSAAVAAATGGESMKILHVITGVVRRQKAFALETMLWRVTRGNAIFRPTDMDQLFEDPQGGAPIRKVAFLALCQGTELKNLTEKICAAFHANLYDCPNTYMERQKMISDLQRRIDDLTQVINTSKSHRCNQLRFISRSLEGWLIRIKKAKAIYFIMNHFDNDITRKCLIGEGWIPNDDLHKVQNILQSETTIGSSLKSFVTKLVTVLQPPTYHRTNRFTHAFQMLISAYGDALYGEMNPGLYTIITFPFLFAVMFGDAGHGLLMLSFSVWMLYNEKKFMAQRSTNEIWNIFFGGRYIMLLMSLFTLYTGFLYNDWFSKPIRLKSNYWINVYTAEILQDEAAFFQLDPAGKTGDTYKLGVDPAWGFATNKIMNENSLKMKLSIIIGIVHMMFGLWLSLFNHIHFKKYYAIPLEFIPQIIILTSLFVWLVIMVFLKWIFYGPKKRNIKLQPGCAPSILILFIDMCLFRTTKVEKDSVCDPYMFKGQAIVQKVLVLLTLLSIPILLFGSPIYLLKTNKKKRVHAEDELKEFQRLKTKLDLDASGQIEKHYIQQVEHYSESFGDLMIHQGVHTIEYVLSTISHTASYLRLWALSLAHGLWAAFSLTILVVMEGLSAFLHTLRLHWVEFMSKFFIGGGDIFVPFSFEDMVYGDKEEKAIAASCKKRK